MKIVLFCKKPYAFGIMIPLYHYLQKQEHNVLWYFPEDIKDNFPEKLNKSNYCHTMVDLVKFNGEINYAPGNDFPYYISGVKVQIFHGMAGEKSGHFHIRHYFDLYLTQGPYFTQRFNNLRKKYKNFEVKETGWCKLDTLFSPHKTNHNLKTNGYENIILYAPTFSPSLTSAIKYQQDIINLAMDKTKFIYIKFHDKMDNEVVNNYKQIAKKTENITISDNPDIIPLLQISDLMISDTSSVVYEFLLLDKPVITFASTSENIRWDDLKMSGNLNSYVNANLINDPHKYKRKWFIENFHPFNDGNSSSRMLEAAMDYIKVNGLPKERKLPFLRRRKVIKTFGKKPFI